MKVIVLLLAAVSAASGFIEKYESKAPIVVIKELKKSTVTLSEVKVYHRSSSEQPWIEMKGGEHSMESSESKEYFSEDEGVKVEMAIYESPNKEWAGLTTVGVTQYISKMVHFGSKVNFLWTSSNNGYFMFLFRVVSEIPDGMEIGLDVITYEGRPEDPSIYSHADSQIKNKNKRITECMNISKEIVELQEMDKMEDGKYRKITKSIFKVIVLTVFLKIFVFIGSLLVINRKIQKFYIEKKIISKA